LKRKPNIQNEPQVMDTGITHKKRLPAMSEIVNTKFIFLFLLDGPWWVT